MNSRLEKSLKLLPYLAAIILINIAGLTLFFRIDLTENKRYSLSKASKKVVSTLSEPLSIKVFFTKKLPAPYNNTEQYLHDLLEEYAISANKYFNYKFYDVSPQDDVADEKSNENQELAKNYGIHPIQIQMLENDELKFKKAFMGLVLIHGDIIERIPTITSTDGLEYELTTTIQKLNNKISALLRLSKKIKVKLFLSSSLKAVAPYMNLNDISGIPDKIKTIVEKLNSKNYGKLEYEYLDPTLHPDLEDFVNKYNITTLKWPELKRDLPSGQGSIGIIIEYGDKTIDIPLLHVFRIPIIGTQYKLAELDNLEESINGSIESLIDINEDLGYVADHGTIDLWEQNKMNQMGNRQPPVSYFRELLSRNYTIKNVKLDEEEIPDSIKCLVIAKPVKEFSDWNLFQIDQALMRGKNLAIMLDSYNEIIPQGQQGMFGNNPIYIPLNTGIEKLLEHYGVTIKKTYVLDENCFINRNPEQMGGGETPIYFAPMIKNQNINEALGFMKGIKGLVALKISPVIPDKARIEKNGLKGLEIFSSSEKSWEMSDNINFNPMLIHPPKNKDEQKKMVLAYMIEGEFPSFFTGKDIPEKPAGDNNNKKDEKGSENADNSKKSGEDLSKIKGERTFISKGKPAKIFIMASGDMIQDQVMDEKGLSPNSTFILNVIDSLNNRDDIAVMRSKKQRFNPLDDMKADTKIIIKSLNIIGLPVFVVLFGFIVLLFRNFRKKQIRMMFRG